MVRVDSVSGRPALVVAIVQSKYRVFKALFGFKRRETQNELEARTRANERRMRLEACQITKARKSFPIAKFEILKMLRASRPVDARKNKRASGTLDRPV